MYHELYDLLLAVVIGAVIGAEREYHSKSAGLRTMIMVSLSSCLFTIMSIKIGLDSQDRIAANILTGLGFVGAGVIFKDENRISGITTATTIWMTAALGMAAGAGYEWLSLFATYRIICPYQRKTLEQYEELFKTYNMKVVRSVQHKTEHRISGRWILIGSAENHKKLTNYLLNDSNIQELSF